MEAFFRGNVYRALNASRVLKRIGGSLAERDRNRMRVSSGPVRDVIRSGFDLVLRRDYTLGKLARIVMDEARESLMKPESDGCRHD